MAREGRWISKAQNIHVEKMCISACMFMARLRFLD